MLNNDKEFLRSFIITFLPKSTKILKKFKDTEIHTITRNLNCVLNRIIKTKIEIDEVQILDVFKFLEYKIDVDPNQQIFAGKYNAYRTIIGVRPKNVSMMYGAFTNLPKNEDTIAFEKELLKHIKNSKWSHLHDDNL